MQLKKFTRKDRHGNMMSFEFDIPQANVPAMQSIPMYDHPGDPKGTDTVPAWLTPGEFVVNKEATEMFGPMIKKINDIGRRKQKQNKAMYAQEGELVPDTSWITDDLLDALRFVETGNLKPEDMVSPKGAIGPYQIMPSNFGAMEGSKTLGKAGFGTPIITEELAKDPEFSRNWAKKYLEGIQKANPNFTKVDVLRAYNAGVGTVNKVKRGVKNYIPEAQQYPGKVMASLQNIQKNKIPGVTAQKVAPNATSSGAQVATDAKFVPPVNVTMPTRNMASMEPIAGPSSGRIAQYLGGIPKPKQPSPYNPQRMMDINNPLGTPVPVRNGIALTPEYLAALQDRDFGGMGADSAMFKTNQQAIIPKVADVYEDDAIMRPGAGRIDATIYPDAAMRPGDQRKDIVPKKPTFLERLEGFRDRLVAENEERKAKKKEVKDMIDINDPQKALTTMFKEYGMNEKQRADFLQKKGEAGLARKADQEKMTKLEPIQEGYDKKDEVAKALTKTTENDPGPGADQPGANNNPETVKETGKKAPPAEQKKAEGFLKGLLGNVFDSAELKRMAIMYLGSRLLGYNHGGSLNFALKQYMERIDAKEAAGRKYATSAAAAKRFTPTSLAKYIQTGNYDDLEYLPTQLRKTGNTKKFYGMNKQGKRITVVGEEFKVGSGDNAQTVYYDRNGTEIKPLNFTENPMYVPKSNEYNDAMVKYQELFAKSIRDNQNNNIAGKKDGKNIYYDGLKGVTGDAARVAEWALDNKVDLGDMPSLINLAYNDLVEDAKTKEYKPTSLIPYLNSLKIRQSVKGLDFLSLLRTEPKSQEEKKRGYGKVVNSKDFERLRQNAINFMKVQNPAFQNITDDNKIAIEWFRAATEDWAALTDDVKEQWERKANKADSTGFFEWAKTQLRVDE